MSYREYSYDGKLTRRWSDYRRRFRMPEQNCSAEYLQATRELIARIGRDGFYAFSSALPDHVVLSERQHLAAILERLHELDQQDPNGQQLTFPGFETYLQFKQNPAERGNKTE